MNPQLDLRCLLVDDHQMFVELLLPVLRSIPGLVMVGTAGSATQAIGAVKQLKPDLLILDLDLPDHPGIRVAEVLQQRQPQARLIVLSGHASSFLCPPSLQPLLHAVVDKTSAFQELRHEIRLLLHDSATQVADEEPADLAERHGLTPRELEVLSLVGLGCNSRVIAETLGISEHTVGSHRRALRSKLGVSGGELIRLAALGTHGR